jgi:hypothetical protein
MTSMLKHFNPYEAPSRPQVPRTLSIAPTVQTVIVDRVAVVNPQFTPVIRDKAESEMPSPEDSHSSRPTHSEMIPPSEARPISTSVPIVDHMAPTIQIRLPTTQVRAPTTLSEIEAILPE